MAAASTSARVSERVAVRRGVTGAPFPPTAAGEAGVNRLRCPVRGSRGVTTRRTHQTVTNPRKEGELVSSQERDNFAELH
ncbi:hypothetical protein Cme02nite_25500 [Catellatospora methionotrophica]|uniref:Uncharacterized protein n=1 Tax=Catellatospora methionotrophica TaxID=121620 RepID=A0A8J3L9Q6_9ACTN|nr:hypothetical protein Cme02nite_25500 [Catellatospora methionotrophica]